MSADYPEFQSVWLCGDRFHAHEYWESTPLAIAEPAAPSPLSSTTDKDPTKWLT